MVEAVKSTHQFREFVDEAGLGSLIWGGRSYRVARHYHYIVAALTAGIVFFTLVGRLNPALLFAWLGLYLLYVAVRKIATRRPAIDAWFYHRRQQFWRAMLGVVGITAMLISAPGSESASLWVLYALVILLASKHCTTEQMATVGIASWLGLVAVRLSRGASVPAIFTDAELWADGLTLALLAFVFHYLVRNVQARDGTIDGYRAVIALAREIDLAETSAARHWQPILEILLQRFNASCASTWTLDPKSNSLRCAAGVQKTNTTLEWPEFDGNTPRLSLDSNHFAASVFRERTFACNYQPDGTTHLADCPPVATELAIPIDLGEPEAPSVAGVLLVGLGPEAFRANLMRDYETFMRGLVDQARPILLYERRLADLVALQEVSRKVWRSADRSQVLDNILGAIVESLGFEFATVSLVDEERQLIRSVRGRNVPQKWLDMASHPLDSNDIQACVVTTGRTEILSGRDPRFDKRIWHRFNHKSLVRIFIPIRIIDPASGLEKIIGTIEAGYRRATVNTIGADQRRQLETFVSQVSMAIAHTTLLEQARQHAEVLTSLHHTGQVIGSARQAAQVLRDIAVHAQELLKADVVMLYRYHRDTGVIDAPVIAGESGRAYRLNLHLDESSLLTRLVSDPRPYYSTDARHDALLNPDRPAADDSTEDRPGRKASFVRWHNIRSVAGLPLLANGEIVGVMVVNYRHRHQFDKAVQQAHELFAQQAAVALKNAEASERQRDWIVREERDHLSYELHHFISQALYGIALKARNALRDLSTFPGQVTVALEDIREIARVATDETGFIIDELRAPVDETRYFETGLETFAQRIRRWYHVDIAVERDLRRPLPSMLQSALLRFAREGVINAARHAHSQHITVRCESYRNRVEVAVSDDGVGFLPDQPTPNKLGLKSMRELATSLGGLFDLQTSPGAGTRVSLVVFQDPATEDRHGP